MTRQSFADRLYAERLSASLRFPDLFWNTSLNINVSQTEEYIRERAEAIRIDLSSSGAGLNLAINDVEMMWNVDREGQSKSQRRVISLLSVQAKNLLQHSGREMMLRVARGEPGREILRWRFVSLALPPTILIALATRRDSTPPHLLRLLNNSIAPDHPTAHNHVHHAAMMSFEELWASLQLRALLDWDKFEDSLRDKRAYCPGLHPFLLGG
jgi:hypothetical protein